LFKGEHKARGEGQARKISPENRIGRTRSRVWGGKPELKKGLEHYAVNSVIQGTRPVTEQGQCLCMKRVLDMKGRRHQRAGKVSGVKKNLLVASMGAEKRSREKARKGEREFNPREDCALKKGGD